MLHGFCVTIQYIKQIATEFLFTIVVNQILQDKPLSAYVLFQTM